MMSRAVSCVRMAALLPRSKPMVASLMSVCPSKMRYSTSTPKFEDNQISFSTTIGPADAHVDVARQSRDDRLFGKIELELRAHHAAVLKSYSWFIETTAKELDITVTESEGEENPHKTRKTLLKSAFVHSKARAQYEMRTFYWVMTFERLTESTKDTFLEYIQRNLPEGVAMRVILHEQKRVPESILSQSVDKQNE